TLGDGSRWKEIVELNRGHEVAPGVVFDGSPDRLLPGWRLLVPSDSPTVAVPDSAPTARPVSAAAPATSATSAAPIAADHTMGAGTEHSGETTVRVERGDTLSEIAAERLGDANDWRTLWEANRGHRFDGRVFDNPNLILAGWELIVPEVMSPPPRPVLQPLTQDRTADQTAVATPPPPQPATPTVAPAPSAALPSPTPGTVPVDSTPPTAPNAVPSAPLGAATPIAPTPSAPITTIAAAPSTGADSSPHLYDQDSEPAPVSIHTVESRHELAVPAGLGAAVLVSSGAIGAVASIRRRRLRSAGVFARLAEPSPVVAHTETVLRRLDDGDRIARLDLALRAAASELVVDAPSVVILGAILERDGTLDLLLSGSAPLAPQPWSAVSDHRWRLAAEVGLAELAPAARRSSLPCPAIVHLGATPTDGATTADLFIDLEAIGLLVVDSRSHAVELVRAIATALALSPMAEIAHLITCGLEPTHLSHPSTRAAASLDAALELAARSIGTTASATSAALRTFTLRARHQGGEAWEPAIVTAVGTDAEAALDAELLRLTAVGGRGLAVVLDRPVEGAPWRLEQQATSWVLHPLELELTPIGLTADDVRSVEVLLDEADRPLLNEPDPFLDGDLFADIDRSEMDWSLMVRVLGPVEVVDAQQRAADFERSKALELVVWLSQHRDRPTRTAARTALWESDVRDATFANVVSDARRALARLTPPIDGEEWVARTLTEHLPLHRLVVTDADLLGNRLAVARSQPAAEAIETLRPSLALVREMPFAGTSYLWPDAEGISSQLILLVTSAAAVLATHYLTLGDTAGVFWATGQGLKVLAGHEELIALRMRAHSRHGDLAGVRQEWESYERVLLSDAWCEEPSPKLVALRRELLSPSLMQV
ncbi:MAG TPA: hypothetical protein VGM78_09940, partial [Ilumatobacteraceae bacterium]